MHSKNAFITLTYDDDHLVSEKLDYRDFQLFMKKLRKTQDDPMGVFVTGEYGEKTKRPHWHAIIFGWSPSDGIPDGKSETGDQYYSSSILTKLWGKGRCNYGAVTFKSAGYVARYAAKKLVHGKDQDHDFHPVSKKSNKHAIGKAWLEKFWPDVFNHGQIILPDGASCSIPRYYEKWFKENHPSEYRRYLDVKVKKSEHAIAKTEKENEKWLRDRHHRLVHVSRTGGRSSWVTHPREARQKILKSKFEQLQNFLKL